MSIKFHLPSFTRHYKLNMIYLDMIKKYPHFMYENAELASFFDSFPPAVWSGGRTHQGMCDESYVDMVLKSINAHGIPLRFTFTNPMLTKEHLSDKFCNMIMKKADNGLNEVVVVSPILEDYIRKKYPKYKITSSTCKRLDDIESLNNELQKPYDMVVLDYDLNNQYDLLKQIVDKKRCEILVNASCIPKCARRKNHYASTGLIHIAFYEHLKRNPHKPFDLSKVKLPDEMNIGYCKTVDYSLFQIKKFVTHINPDDLYNKYVPMGFENFKLEGRSANTLNLIENYMYYMMKPECRDEARFMLFCCLKENGFMEFL